MYKRELFLILLCASLMVNLYQFYVISQNWVRFKTLKENYWTLKENYLTLKNEYNKLTYLFNLIENYGSIQTSYDLYIVKKDLDYTYRVAAVIYCPESNSTLHLELCSLRPEDKVYLPISVQKGNAFKRDEATSIWQFKENGTIENILVAPIIFYVNTTKIESYEIPINEGWYTISIVNPIGFHKHGTLCIYGNDYIWKLNETINITLKIKILHNEKAIPFVISQYSYLH